MAPFKVFCVAFVLGLIHTRLVKFHSPAFFSSSTGQRPHVNWKIQSPQHDEAEHQSIDSILLESGQDAGLGVPSPAAVLRRPGALPQTWAERCTAFLYSKWSTVSTTRHYCCLFSQLRSPSLDRINPSGDHWNWLRSCVRSQLTLPQVPETCPALSMLWWAPFSDLSVIIQQYKKTCIWFFLAFCLVFNSFSQEWVGKGKGLASFSAHAEESSWLYESSAGPKRSSEVSDHD